MKSQHFTAGAFQSFCSPAVHRKQFTREIYLQSDSLQFTAEIIHRSSGIRFAEHSSLENSSPENSSPEDSSPEYSSPG
jgi:hypothetical protein